MSTFARLSVALGIVGLWALQGCRTNVGLYAGVDPATRPHPSEPLYIAGPGAPTIRERQIELVLRATLARRAFNVVPKVEDAAWVLDFKADQETYVSGLESSGLATSIGNTGLTVGGSTAKVRRQTDFTLSLQAYRPADLGSPNPYLYWEGSVTAQDKVMRAYPNAILEALLECFGQDAQKRLRIRRELPSSSETEGARDQNLGSGV